jgi:hypothetical protein
MYQLTSLSVAVLAAAGRIAASTPSVGVDLSDFTGNAMFLLSASATEAAATTADFKVQSSDTLNGTYVDSGIVFTQVTNAGPSVQRPLFTTDGLKRFVRVMPTLGGTSPAVTYSLAVIGKKSV